jgi:hypothetical protein
MMITLTSRDERMIPLDQIGHIEVRMEDPIFKRRDRMPTITVRGDIDEPLNRVPHMPGCCRARSNDRRASSKSDIVLCLSPRGPMRGLAPSQCGFTA